MQTWISCMQTRHVYCMKSTRPPKTVLCNYIQGLILYEKHLTTGSAILQLLAFIIWKVQNKELISVLNLMLQSGHIRNMMLGNLLLNQRNVLRFQIQQTFERIERADPINWPGFLALITYEMSEPHIFYRFVHLRCNIEQLKALIIKTNNHSLPTTTKS